jgi:ABC-type transport system involved in multi-copper enzyme maturation permease subunit
MFKLVSLDIIRLLVLIATLFATSKSIYEEIEDRTMLTLMSKPVQRVEVLVGKYLGIILAAALMMAALGLVLCIATWWRIPTDYLIPARSLDDVQARELLGLRQMHLAGIPPALLLDWMQISVLAAIGVALSVRVSLVVNLPIVIILYILCNLTRFLYPVDRESVPTKVFAFAASTVLPALELFDIRDNVVHKKLAIAQFSAEPGALALSTVWGYVGFVGLYAVVYVFFVLTLGMWLFKNRELGGAEG